MGMLEVGLSVALYEEYVDVLNRAAMREILSNEDREAFLDFFCARSVLLDVFYLWRPILKDPKDDLVLEAGVAFGAGAILTYNIKHFIGCETFGIRALKPSDYLNERKMK
jgi:predicted nucleic acid-binding protein